MRLTAMILALCMLAGLACAQGVNNPPPTSTFQKILLKDGITAPATKTGWGQVYVDVADGLVKIKDGAGNVSILDATSAVATHEAGYDHVATGRNYVVKVSKTNVVTPYPASADTNVARGTALITAVAAAVSGDTIQLAGNTYDLGAANIILPAGVSLVGKGMAATTITTTATLGTIGPAVVPGSNSLISDLKIVNTGVGVPGSTYQACLGVYWSTTEGKPQIAVPSSFTARNVYCVAYDHTTTDCFYVCNHSASPCAMRLEHCIFEGYGDTGAIFGKSTELVENTTTLDAYDCQWLTRGDIDNANLNGMYIGNNSTVQAKFYNCVFSAGVGGVAGDSAPARNAALLVGSATASAECFGCKFVSVVVDGAETWDIWRNAGTVALHGCAFDLTKVYGAYVADPEIRQRSADSILNHVQSSRASTALRYKNSSALNATYYAGTAYITGGYRIAFPEQAVACTDDATNYIYALSDGTLTARTSRTGSGMLIGTCVAASGSVGTPTDLRVCQVAGKIINYPSLDELNTRWPASATDGGIAYVDGDGVYISDNGDPAAWAKIDATTPP